MADEEGRRGLIAPSQMESGGGLLGAGEGIDVEWKAVRAVMWDYRGKMSTKSPAVHIAMVTLDGEEVEEYWSAGDAKIWTPSADGKSFRTETSHTGISADAKAGILFGSLVNAGFDEQVLLDGEGLLDVMDGVRCHMFRVAAPKRPGLAARPSKRADGREYEETILVVDKLLEDAEKPSKTKAPAKKGKGAGKDAQAAGGADHSDAATVVVLNALADPEYADGILKSELPAFAFKALTANGTDKAERNGIVSVVADDEFLSAGPWEFEDGKVSRS